MSRIDWLSGGNRFLLGEKLAARELLIVERGDCPVFVIRITSSYVPGPGTLLRYVMTSGSVTEIY